MSDGCERGSARELRIAKVAKGARDFDPAQMQIRDKVFATVRRVFRRHAAVEIDTPVFELRDALTGKYGEDSKLIYDLADQGGELLSLRYDLTVPFARWLACNSTDSIKRFHIARVYRRDNPAIARGRFREFYQCDFDVAGEFARMVPDAEVIAVGCEVLASLPVGDFVVKLNHRVLLDAMLELCGVPERDFRPVCSAIDKLGKEPWEVVREEMVGKKGLDPIAADRVKTFVDLSGEPRTLLRKLEGGEWFGDHARAREALADLSLLCDYLDAMGSLPYVSLDLSLARGLDYYTGTIYEIVLQGERGAAVGSVAAGGRYDNLMSTFSARRVPCVGISIGIERVLAIVAQGLDDRRVAPPSVFVASIGAHMLQHRMRVCRELWAHGISAEFMQQETPKLTKQLQRANDRGHAYVVLFGEDELASGQVKIKVMSSGEQAVVQRVDVARELVARGCPVEVAE